MAACLTDGAVYEINVTRRMAHCIVRIPHTVTLVEDAEIKERIHRGLEWALAPYFVGKFVKAGCSTQ